MILLSNVALDYAYEVCIERSVFFVVVACNEEAERCRAWDYLQNKLSDDINTGADERMCILHHGGQSLFFANGSFIKIINVDESARWNRAHLVLIDKNIPENVISETLGHIELGEIYWQLRENERQVEMYRNEIRSDRIRQLGVRRR